jgi:hypothetical protein
MEPVDEKQDCSTLKFQIVWFIVRLAGGLVLLLCCAFCFLLSLAAFRRGNAAQWEIISWNDEAVWEHSFEC